MTTSQAILLGYLYNDLLIQTKGIIFPPGRRAQLSLACYCIVRDHHHAIALLLDKRLYASAFALVRPIYEATVKGMWIGHCAPESDLEKHAIGKELLQINELVDDLLKSQLPPLVSDQLKKIKKKYWKGLSSLTHAGHIQVQHWLTPDGVDSTYTEVEIKEIANFTGFMAVVASLEEARLGQNEKAMASISMLLPLQ